MHGAAGFLDSFVQDELNCRCLSEEDFGAPLDNKEADVSLMDMYNRGLTLCQDGRERTNLALEGGRPGATGYIPSMEQGVMLGASPKPKALVLDLGAPNKELMEQSLLRRGLRR
jgi:hypothetical protein